ncbi:HupE/UreJ family protein [Rhizobiales bacterium]|uniref:HupE/UreJ family protein n=1 Tax=Hongsoonwoonella zoysiae TaxID=2821844 RepID=UPI0015609BB6|nr:HupE/UreJ family protein [Hongsoonwoonella zoysiae]NRG17744.1 HupE/UreJ family protein [Hongsoonwoonella zoysiae]
MMRCLVFLISLAFAGFGHTGAQAHELRPAYLEITEATPGIYDILWKVPARGEFRLSLNVRLPDNCTETAAPVTINDGAAVLSRWSIACEGGLAGRTISIDGLAATFTDALVRIAHLDGSVQSARLMPDYPEVTVETSPTLTDTARTYFLLGVEHILLGFDHLLFVLALLLLIGSLRTLVETITAFTVAHSITLAFTTLGLANAPQQPVEALIALSIVFVAAEILRKENGRIDFSSRYPWVIAFLFGLLHGFGFGGALREIGLPQQDVPLALLTFNLGVEAGQLIFVALALLAIAGLKLLLAEATVWPKRAVTYAIGSVSAVWFVERVAGF